jgi:hypothetical protein
VGGIPAAAAQTAAGRNPFFQMQPQAGSDTGGGEEKPGRTTNQIAVIGGQAWVVTSELQTLRGGLAGQRIVEGNRVENAFQFVKSIRPPAQYIEQQIDFTRGLLFQRH